MADAAAELPGYLHHRLLEETDGSVLVCIAEFSVEQSARTYCGGLSEGREHLTAAYGGELRDISVMREIVELGTRS